MLVSIHVDISYILGVGIDFVDLFFTHFYSFLERFFDLQSYYSKSLKRRPYFTMRILEFFSFS
jgi:hypothetical protein